MDRTSTAATGYQTATALNGHVVTVATEATTAQTATQAACPGVLIVLVGPSGVGKNTIMQGAIAALPRLSQMPTATTRPPRSNEQHGREHWFLSLEQFQAMIAADDLIEYQEVHPGRFYGTPRRQIFQTLHDDHAWLIADIDIAGASALRKVFPQNAVLIFIEPPDLETLQARMRARGQVSETEIQERLARVPRELAFAVECDYRVLNTNLTDATQQVITIIQNEAQRRQCG